MSDKSLQALVDICIEAENWRDYRHEYRQVIEMTNARIRRAEAAERVAEAWLAWDEDDFSIATLDAYAQALAAYKTAREAVRKLEKGE